MVVQVQTRMAGEDDRARMLDFLADHWRSDHIFVVAPHVFDWQYRRTSGDYNVALALDDTGMVLGFLGYIPTGQFDPALGYDEIMLAIWKVRDDMALPGVGLRLLKLIEKTHKPRLIGAIGISDMVGPIYKAFKYTLSKMSHAALFLRPGPIAQNVPDAAYRRLEPDSATLAPLYDEHAIDGPGLAKSWAYLQNRYVNHPYYEYALRGVFDGDVLQTIIVWRKVSARGGAVLRIVDLVGSPQGLSRVTGALRAETDTWGADYLDLMHYGVDAKMLREAGFASPDDHPDLILPNYFAPFEASNQEIKLAYRGFPNLNGNRTFFRADSDQDRPNLLSELEKK